MQTLGMLTKSIGPEFVGAFEPDKMVEELNGVLKQQNLDDKWQFSRPDCAPHSHYVKPLSACKFNYICSGHKRSIYKPCKPLEGTEYLGVTVRSLVSTDDSINFPCGSVGPKEEAAQNGEEVRACAAYHSAVGLVSCA